MARSWLAFHGITFVLHPGPLSGKWYQSFTLVIVSNYSCVHCCDDHWNRRHRIADPKWLGSTHHDTKCQHSTNYTRMATWRLHAKPSTKGCSSPPKSLYFEDSKLTARDISISNGTQLCSHVLFRIADWKTWNLLQKWNWLINAGSGLALIMKREFTWGSYLFAQISWNPSDYRKSIILDPIFLFCIGWRLLQAKFPIMWHRKLSAW